MWIDIAKEGLPHIYNTVSLHKSLKPYLFSPTASLFGNVKQRFHPYIILREYELVLVDDKVSMLKKLQCGCQTKAPNKKRYREKHFC